MNEVVAPDLSGIAADLNVLQVQTIEMLLNGNSVAEIQEAIGVTPSQITRWHNSSPEFKRALASAKQYCLEVACHETKLFSCMGEVVDGLLDIMKTAGMEKDRVAAAKQLMDFYHNARDHATTRADLASLKEALANVQKKTVADIVQEPYNKDAGPVISVSKPEV